MRESGGLISSTMVRGDGVVRWKREAGLIVGGRQEMKKRKVRRSWKRGTLDFSPQSRGSSASSSWRRAPFDRTGVGQEERMTVLTLLSAVTS